MASSDREKIHFELLEALYTARKQVEALEAALAHNAAFLGTGVEREGQIGQAAPDASTMPGALMRYLQLVEPEEDISDFIGREGHDESRPRLGPDAPAHVRPNKQPAVSPLVGQLALGHPDDVINFGLTPVPTDDVDVLSGPASAAAPSPASGLTSGPVSGQAPAVPPRDAPESADGAPVSGVTPFPVKNEARQTPGAFSRPAAGPPSVPAPAVSCRPNCLFRDESDSERAYLALRAINDGIWDWNVVTGELYYSPRWEAIVGVPPDGGGEDPLEALVKLLQPADAANLRRRFANLLQGHRDRIRATVRFARGSGWGWGVLRAVALRDKGTPIRVTAVLADITAQREAEIALYASNEKFRAMADDSPDVIARFDHEGRFLYVSPTISRYFAVSPREMTGKPLNDFDMSGGRGFFLKNVENVFLNAQPGQAEIMLDSPLAGKLLADCRFWPEFGVDGQVVSVSMLLRDMTFSRRLAQNYYALFNRMEDGFILFEHVQGWEGGRLTFGPEEFSLVVMNPALSRMFRMEPPDITGLRLHELMGEEADLWAACLKEVLLEERPAHLELHMASGDYAISAYSPEKGRVACIVKDVTELKKIEQETRLNEARLAAVHRLSHMDAASEEAVIRYSLEQAVKLTGSAFGFLHVAGRREGDKEQVYWSQGLPLRQNGAVPGGIQILPWMENDRRREIRHSEVVNAARGNFADAFGMDISVERYTVAPIMDEGRMVCLVGVANKKEPYSSSDLRQLDLFINGMWFHLRRRWAVQALREAKEEAEAASRAKNEFLANVSHELRTPLNGILGMLQVLQQSPLTPEQMECVLTANYSGRSLLRIISDILDFSRIEAGRFELVPQLFDFAATVRSTLGMFTHQAKQKHIDFSLHIDPNIPKLLVGDDARLRQIIFNIVGNSFKFTSRGEISVDCSLLPRCAKGGCCIYLAVKDTGIGIPDNKLEYIFHAFTQLDSSSTRRYAGTGLGLAIVRRLVEMMNGAISVESEPGKGTTVHCSLVFDIPKGVESSGITPHVESGTARPLDILVVEDDPVSQFTLKALLKKDGYECLCVGDGRQALEALLLHAFDCIITDIQMPEMDGMEMTRRIREGETADVEPSEKTAEFLGVASWRYRLSIPRDIPIIALTAYAMAGDRERFLGMGVDYYLPKPVNASELSAMLAHISTLLQARKGE